MCEPMIRLAAARISRNRPDLFEDLHQVGRLALFRLLGRYDSTVGAQFETYAMKSMVGHMKNYLRDKSWYVQVPRRIKEKGIHVRQTIDELTAQLERPPSVEEIAERLGLSRDETLEVLAGRDMYHCVSLDTPVFDRERLPTGVVLQGPAVIEEMSSTTLVGVGHRAEVDVYGNLVITLKEIRND